MIKVKCFVCGNDNENATYLGCVNEGQEKHVCVRCLPALIHGKH